MQLSPHDLGCLQQIELFNVYINISEVAKPVGASYLAWRSHGSLREMRLSLRQDLQRSVRKKRSALACSTSLEM